MTTFSYRFDLNDSERLALERALKIAIDHCDAEIRRGVKCPNIATRETCAELLKRLYAAPATQTSSYTPPQEAPTLAQKKLDPSKRRSPK